MMRVARDLEHPGLPIIRIGRHFIMHIKIEYRFSFKAEFKEIPSKLIFNL